MMRSWDVTVEYLVAESFVNADEVEVVTHRVQAETVQQALRVLVLTSTNNGRVTRIDVREVEL